MMIRNYLLAWLFGISACFIARSVGLEAIIGGHRVVDYEFTYQVSLQHNGQHFCGGGAAHKKFILTAAQCVVGIYFQLLYHNIIVLAGTNNLRKTSAPAVTRGVHKIYIHTDFDPRATPHARIGDIAVLELYENLPVRKHFITLQLPPNKFSSYNNRAATITGFGWTWANVINRTQLVGGTSDSQLRWAEAKVLPLDDSCYRRRTVTSSNKTICARLEQSTVHASGVCEGDQGGPLVLDVMGPNIIGILSTGPYGCSEVLSGATYTRITEYLGFIRNVKTGKINKKKTREYVLPNPTLPGSSLGTSA